VTSPLSPTVLGLGALLSSPALLASLVDGTLPLETGLIRFGVACLVCWVGLVLLDTLLDSTSAAPVREEPNPLEATQVLPPVSSDGAQSSRWADPS
jgi:hypothetical protein